MAETVTLTGERIKHAKEVIDEKAQIKPIESFLMVDLSRLRREIRHQWEPIQDAINALVEEHGEGEEGAKSVKPNTLGMRKFSKALAELLKREVTFTLESSKIEFSRLKFKERDPDTGEMEERPFPMSADDYEALEPFLILDGNGNGSSAKKGKAKDRALKAE